MNIELPILYINERYKILQERIKGSDYVTPDPILRTYRFCNVLREDDRVTKALRATWMKPEDNHDDLPLVALLARRLNRDFTFFNMDRPTCWDSDYLLRQILEGEKNYGNKFNHNRAYQFVSKKGMTCHETTCFMIQQARELIVPRTTLAEASKELQKVWGVSTFMSAQIVADLKHTKYLDTASDWRDWAAIGPGSRRGLNLLYGNPAEDMSNDKNFIPRLLRVREKVEPHINKEVPKMCLQDWQGVLCEVDKYHRFSQAGYMTTRHKLKYYPDANPELA